jgi:hypothetical protein
VAVAAAAVVDSAAAAAAVVVVAVVAAAAVAAAATAGEPTELLTELDQRRPRTSVRGRLLFHRSKRGPLR